MQLIHAVPRCFVYALYREVNYNITGGLSKNMALFSGLRSAWLRGAWTSLASRNIFTTYAVSAQTKSTTVQDPVQKLFLEKMKEYKQKSKGGSLPDSTPVFEARYKEEMEKVKRQFGGGELDKFPQFNFKDE